MKLPRRGFPVRSSQRGTETAFTLVEVMVALLIMTVVMAGALAFVQGAAVSISGVTAQNALIGQAGSAIDYIQDRSRLATSMSNDVSGNLLALGFDDDTTVDSDGDGKKYNDTDHFEQFVFEGVNSTNFASCDSNRLVYFPNVTSTNSRVLIPRGVRNLPDQSIFRITNQVIAIIRLGIVDNYEGDYYQAIDLQGTAVSLNRPAATNIIALLP